MATTVCTGSTGDLTNSGRMLPASRSQAGGHIPPDHRPGSIQVVDEPVLPIKFDRFRRTSWKTDLRRLDLVDYVTSVVDGYIN